VREWLNAPERNRLRFSEVRSPVPFCQRTDLQIAFLPDGGVLLSAQRPLSVRWSAGFSRAWIRELAPVKHRFLNTERSDEYLSES